MSEIKTPSPTTKPDVQESASNTMSSVERLDGRANGHQEARTAERLVSGTTEQHKADIAAVSATDKSTVDTAGTDIAKVSVAEKVEVETARVGTTEKSQIDTARAGTAEKSKGSWRQFASPVMFDRLAAKLFWPLMLIALICAVIGFTMGFIILPPDAVQGNSYRILFLHVPSSWLAMIIYLAMAFWAIIYWVLRTKMAAVMMQALAPSGAIMAAISLLTGSIWGRPTWGTYWVWDARLTSMLLLFFLYLGFIALTRSITQQKRADMAGAILAVVGALNVPIIYFSVVWWNTLHQGASISFQSGVSMHESIFISLLLMTIACWSYCIAVVLARARILILQREASHRWALQRYANTLAQHDELERGV